MRPERRPSVAVPYDDAEIDIPVHGRVGPLQVALDFIDQQVEATETFCEQYQSDDVHSFPGCPLTGGLTE